MTTPDSTVVDPDGHRVVFENEHVRVLEVRVREGHDLPIHTHPPRVVVAVGSYRLRVVEPDGSVSVFDRRPGEVGWTNHEEHEARVLIGPVHAIEVEVKSASS